MHLAVSLLIVMAAFIASATAQLKVFSYYNYASTGIQPWQLDCSQFTHLIWAFAHLQENGKISLQGPPNFPDNEKDATQTVYPGSSKCICSDNCLQGQLGIFHRMKNSCPHVKLLVSVGGWTWSTHFSAVLKNDALRKTAVTTATELINKYGFDGLDIDWEFPNFNRVDDPKYQKDATDLANLAKFAKELKTEWGSNMKELTLAMQAYVVGDPASWKLLGQYLDYGLVMGYEFQHTNTRIRPGSPLRSGPMKSGEEAKSSVEDAVMDYEKVGFPRSKMVVGVPLYGVGWTGINLNDRDSDMAMQTPGLGVKITSNSKQLTKFPMNTVDSVIKGMNAAYNTEMETDIYTNSSHVVFIESVRSVEAKTDFAMKQQLAGMMVWNSNQDLPGDRSLLGAIAKKAGLKFSTASQTGFCLEKSDFCNLRCSELKKDPLNGVDFREVATKAPQSPSKSSSSSGSGKKDSSDFSSALNLQSPFALVITLVIFLSLE